MGLYLLSRGPHCESPWTNGQITSGQWRLGSRGTRSYQEPGSRGTTFIGPSPLYFTTVPPSLGNPPPRVNPSRFCTLPLPESSATPSSARKADSPLHVSARNFPPLTLCTFTWETFSRAEWILRLPQVDFTDFQWEWLLVCFSGVVSFWDGMWWKNIW